MNLKSFFKGLFVVVPAALSLTGCAVRPAVTGRKPLNVPDDKYRTSYEVFVYSFYDGNGDGIGDLKGLTEKLDYINDGNADTDTDLGANEIWLMPISPSDSYHKYDVMDYMAIDKDYGTLDDFKKLLDECHKRGIKVILDLVMNHSSSMHPWFISATDYIKGLSAGEKPDASVCPYFNYYNFTKESQGGYAPIDGTEWFYEARFSPRMPDFNLDEPAVRKEFKKIVKFWLDLGADGFRLDAVTYYVTGNVTKNTEILTWLNKTVKEVNPNAYIVGEAWSNINEYAAYYESGVDSFFDFDFSGNEGVIAKVLKGVLPASDYVDRQVKSDEIFASKSDSYINAPFYTNHDMARSAGYYSGEHKVSLTKLSGAMNLFMRGNAFIYYGEEIGMKGSGKDENKRAPMQWSADPSAKGMCVGPKDMEEVKMMYGDLEKQQEDELSIYNYYKKAIRIRNTYPAIARGETASLSSVIKASSGSVAAFTRLVKDESFEPVAIFINVSEKDTEITLPDGFEFKNLSDELTTEGEKVILESKKLKLPKFGVAVLVK